MSLIATSNYVLSPTTQGPSYPPSEIMNADGDFVVVGYLNEEGANGSVERRWGVAIVSRDTPTPAFGEQKPYLIKRQLKNWQEMTDEEDFVLFTLPIPLVCNNYPMNFAPAQQRITQESRTSLALHKSFIPDERSEDGRKLTQPVTYKRWMSAKGELLVSRLANGSTAYELSMTGLVAGSLYSVMALRRHDLRTINPTRPGPLGIPNVFVPDDAGCGTYRAIMPESPANPIINVIVLLMSTQMSYGGAIGYYGLGGDIHAQLKLKVGINP